MRYSPPDAGCTLDMKLLASHRAPQRAQRRRTAVRAVFYGFLVLLAIALAYGYMLATIVIAVDHRRWIWPWIAVTFIVAGLILLGSWLAEHRRAHRGSR